MVAAVAAVMAVVMGVALAVKVLMVVGMGMVMSVLVGMFMGMGLAVMGMLMAVAVGMSMVMGADMVMVKMHSNLSFSCFLYYSSWVAGCQRISFHPSRGLAVRTKMGYNGRKFLRKGATAMEEHHDHAYLHAHGIAHSHGHVHENQKAVLNRLARAIGHLEKVKRMVEEGVDCSEVLIQLAAVRSALDNTGKVILKDHMRHCMVDAVAAGDQDAIDDLCQAIDKFMK